MVNLYWRGKELVKVRSKGFTLIELMVAISIVAILATVGIIQYSSAQAIARDSKRRQTLKEIALALETYKTAMGTYPISPSGTWNSSEEGDPYYHGVDYIPGLAPIYMTQLPRDPQGGQGNSSLLGACASYKKSYYYASSANGQEYKLLAHCSMEVLGWNNTDPFYDPTRPTHALQVCQGAAACTW